MHREQRGEFAARSQLVTGSAITLTLIVAVVLQLREPIGRVPDGRGSPPSRSAVATAATQSSSAGLSLGAVPSGDFGSGRLDPWRHRPHTAAGEYEIRDVLMSNGVFLFGDDLALQDGNPLEHLLISRVGEAIAMHNWSGQPTSAAVDALAHWQQQYGLPGRIVMDVGSNDIFDPPAFAAQAERAMRIAGPHRTVYWVNIRVSRIDQTAAIQAADQRNSAWINQQLDDTAARHPNLRIVRWAEYLSARPVQLTTHLRDGMHTSIPIGQNARNELIARALHDG